MKRMGSLFSPSTKLLNDDYRIKEAKTMYITQKTLNNGKKIRDYFDNSEINQKIQSLSKTSDKMKLIDEIMEERKRIEKRNKRVKIETMLPYISSPSKSRKTKDFSSAMANQDFRNNKEDPKIQSFFKKLRLAKDIKQSQRVSISTNVLFTAATMNKLSKRDSGMSKSLITKNYSLNKMNDSYSPVPAKQKGKPETKFQDKKKIIQRQILKRIGEIQMLKVKKAAKEEFQKEMSVLQGK